MADSAKTLTIGLPLPNRSDYEFDVSMITRKCLLAMEESLSAQGWEIFEKTKRGINVAEHHNALANEMEGDWLLIVGHDHGFLPDAGAKLLEAAQEEPHPRILAALMPYRHPPYAYVATRYAQHGKNPRPILPWRDFHPMDALTERILECDTVGSGFTLYHRSVFDTVPYPWFLYAPYLSRPKLEAAILDFEEGERSFPEFLQDLANGKPFTNGAKEKLEKKAKDLRWILAQARNPTPFGPDYYCCVKAKDYGIQSYVHFGCRVSHFDFVPIMHDNYIRQMQDETVFWQEALRARAPTEENIQDVRELWNEKNRMAKMSVDELLAERGSDKDIDRPLLKQVEKEENERLEGSDEESPEPIRKGG